ncbi:MAG: heparan N-sulfatase, partial [Planctomycetia bacterium]|nr:heparan N-sulfatase [Planctomycetia bacterium]
KKAAPKQDAATKAAPRKRNDLLAFALPQSITPGKPVTVRIEHKLPGDLGEQVLSVTLKGGPDGKRLDRKTVKASGDGIAEVAFDVPAEVPGSVVSFAAFVGEDYQNSLQHIQSPPQSVR